MADVRFSVTKLNNTNYEIWSSKVELLLIKEDLWHTVNKDKPADANEKWLKADGQARAIIGLLLEDDQFIHFKGATDAKGAWEALRKYHQKASLTNQVHLFKRIINLKLDENGDMEKYIHEMLSLVDRLAAIGETLKEKFVISIMLSNLPDSFGTLITALETRNENELTLELVKGKLVDEAARRRNSKNENQEENKALKVTQRNTLGPGKTTEQPSLYTCYFCKKQGHLKKNCKKYQMWKEKNPSRSNQRATQVVGKRVSADSPSSYSAGDVCFHVEANSVSWNKDDWCIDSGATSHMSNNKKFFLTLRECNNESVRLANGSCARIEGKGDGKILCEDPQGKYITIHIKDVLYVPELKENLISVKSLTEMNFEVNFTKGACEIRNKDKVIVKAETYGDLFKLNNINKALVAVGHHSADCQHTWHRKLGHRDLDAIRAMVLKGTVEGIKIKDCGIKQICDTCVKGKMSRRPFPQKSNSRSNSVLDLIHTDVCGPMHTRTPSQKRYILTLIDDFSRYTTIYLLGHKSETTNKIKEFVRELKTKFGNVPKVFRSDRGTEYINRELKDFFTEQGIKCQYTVSYTPEQNGVAERKNRSLMEMARCLLIDAELDRKYWGEAIHFSNHLQNRLATKATGTTPMERWCGIKPDLKDMHIFGSKAYAHVPKELRRKLDDKAKEFRFVGFDENSKGYRLLNASTDKIVISRDVRFTDSTENTNKEEIPPEKDENNDSIIEYTNKAPEDMDTNENEDNTEDDGHEDEDNTEDNTEDDGHENQNSIGPRRGRGRPRIIRTGGRGRPRKLYTESINNRENLLGYVSEVPLDIAMSGAHADKWNMAMVDEIKSMLEKDVWDLVERPKGRNVVDCRMVMTNKYGPNGAIDRRKARLVARGFSQIPGMDYNETFAPVARLSSIRLAAALAARYEMRVSQIDITTAYLNGSLDEEVYMEMPRNLRIILEKIADSRDSSKRVKVAARLMLEQVKSGNKVCKLKKAIYGLKQAGRQWHTKLDRELRLLGLSSSNFDPCVYRCNKGEELLLVVVYVDDILILCRDVKKIEQIKYGLTKVFSSVKDLGDLEYCLGIEFKISKGKVMLSQKGYVQKLLERFNMADANPVKNPLEPGIALIKENSEIQSKEYPYRELVGSLMYLAVVSRPDISYAVSYLSQFNNCYGKPHWEAAKRVLRYLKGTNEYCLMYQSGNDLLTGYTDADWGGCVIDRRSFTGYIFYFCGGPITWESRKQRTVALSSTEAEYTAIADATKEVLYLSNTLKELGVQTGSDVTIYNDNASALKLVKNPVYHARTKHIAIRHHFLRETLSEEKFNFKYLRTEDMVADVLTKALNGPKHVKCTKALGLIN